jgi:hypothetical protein
MFLKLYPILGGFKVVFLKFASWGIVIVKQRREYGGAQFKTAAKPATTRIYSKEPDGFRRRVRWDGGRVKAVAAGDEPCRDADASCFAATLQ